VTERPRRPGDLAAVVARADRIRAETGWRPRRAALETIVADALAWERRLAPRAGAPDPIHPKEPSHAETR
jgi:UDP-glucose 4-epimerase